jgi:hypothetical protein
MAEVVYAAWQNGTRFDAWQDQRQLAAWTAAFESAKLDPAFYTHRRRAADELFPWEHLSDGMRRKVLYEDYQRSLSGETRADCREACHACGILPTYAAERRENPGLYWKCPEVKSPAGSRGNAIPGGMKR